MNADPTPAYSVVVPVHNSAEMLAELCRRLDATFVSLAAGYEIVLVDDGSRDDSWRVMHDLHAADPRIRIIRLQGGFGQHAATLCGLRHSRGEIVITMDDDLQHPPEEVPKLIAAIRADDDCDAVFGVAAEKEHAAYRNLGSRALNRITSYVFRRDPKLRMSSFRIMRRRTVAALANLRMPEPAIGTMLFVVTRRIKHVIVRHDPRGSGRSGYSLPKMIRVSINSIMNYSALPLQLVSQLGLASAIGSVGLLVYFFIKSQRTSVAGWSSIVVLVTFFGGMILFTLGFIGEYLVRIIKAVNAYPPYLIADSEGVDEHEKSSDPGHWQRPV
jgi:dolichol-phosphate mannosyltransferase/undecaprenyl-phosphate 4-deoxy-4-formamido-L-arabinose transferase